jgi:DNA-directed RNA polymerase I, II, and III subunit RPABC2
MPVAKKSSAIKEPKGTGTAAASQAASQVKKPKASKAPKVAKAPKAPKAPKPAPVKKVPKVKVVKGVLATAGQARPGPSKKRLPVELISGLIGPDHLTRFELARIMGARALQLSFGAPPLIEISSELSDAMGIARAELESRAIPISIRRTLPSGEFQNIPVSDLL